MKTAVAMTVFVMLVLQSGGQIQGADEQPPLIVQSAPVPTAAEPAYCQGPLTSDTVTAALRQDEGQLLLLEAGPGMSRADF